MSGALLKRVRRSRFGPGAARRASGHVHPHRAPQSASREPYKSPATQGARRGKAVARPGPHGASPPRRAGHWRSRDRARPRRPREPQATERDRAWPARRCRSPARCRTAARGSPPPAQTVWRCSPSGRRRDRRRFGQAAFPCGCQNAFQIRSATAAMCGSRRDQATFFARCGNIARRAVSSMSVLKVCLSFSASARTAAGRALISVR
jgi:hypothetical protein